MIAIAILGNIRSSSNSENGKLYLKSATMVQQDGTLADVQFVSVREGYIGTNREETYRAAAFVVNGFVYARVSSANNLIITI